MVSLLRWEPLRWSLAVVCAGLIAGLAGIFLTLVTRAVEVVLWGTWDVRALAGAVATVGMWPRAAIVFGAAVLGALVWFLLGVFARSPVPLGTVVKGARMPLCRTVIHTVTQTVIVAAGVSVGKEVAPRELAASGMAAVSARLGYTGQSRRQLIAAAAGAGLAAVYAVPLAGCAFAVEALAGRRSVRAVLSAAAASAVAVTAASFVVGWEPYYVVPDVPLSWPLIAWAPVAGVLIGGCAMLFSSALRRISARTARRRPVRVLVLLPLAGAGVACASLWLPEVLGNGHSLAQMAVSVTGPVSLAVIGGFLALAVVKALLTLGLIGAGAWGGVLTPSIAMGAALGVACGGVWMVLFPGQSWAGFACVGAAVFLAVVQRTPVTAVLLVAEFGHVFGAVLIPVVLAVVTAQVMRLVVERRRR